MKTCCLSQLYESSLSKFYPNILKIDLQALDLIVIAQMEMPR